jgi:hypothetical protein
MAFPYILQLWVVSGDLLISACMTHVGCYIPRTQVPPATDPPAVRQQRGSAEGCRPSASRGAPPPHLARRGEVVTNTETQTSTFLWALAEPCAPARWPTSELSPTCVTAAWCGTITMVLAREVGALNNTT